MVFGNAQYPLSVELLARTRRVLAFLRHDNNESELLECALVLVQPILGTEACLAPCD